MARPTHTEVIDAIATILEGTATAGEVVRDPRYAGSPERDSDAMAEYARLVMDSSGNPDGWLVVAGPEETPTRLLDGYEQYQTFLLTAITKVNPDLSPDGSLSYFGQKVADAKSALALNTNQNLALSGSGFEVRQNLAFAPDGYFRDQLDTCEIHNGILHLRVWVKDC